MAENEEIKTLGGQDAIDLWLQGEDTWNAWVEKNPVYNLDFSSVDFSQYRGKPTETESISFLGFVFPEGDVDFSFAEFGEGNVDFLSTQFGEGDVNFSGTQFGEGDVNFLSTQFGEGNVNFLSTQFGEGNVDFSGTQFGEGDVNFEKLTFKGRVSFSGLENTENITSFSFRHSTFNDSFEISAKKPFGCIVDLTSTKMSHQISLSGLKCTLRRNLETPKSKKYFPKISGEWLKGAIAEDRKDAERARRLKEIASNNKNHQEALNFHALEMQAERTPTCFPLFLFNTEFWYQKCSDYGRSIIRPLVSMFVIWCLFSFIYLSISGNPCDILRLQILTSSTYSGTQMFSFVPSSRGANKEMLDLLFINTPPPPWIYTINFIQTIISLILIFLLSLGLKNKFKI